MADDFIFTIMATGQEHHGRDGVVGMLNYFYHFAFDATATAENTIFGDGKAMVEGHFAGISATNRGVRVPICVVYDLGNNMIKRGRVYFEMPVLMQQSGV
jgi:hypothetical protein